MENSDVKYATTEEASACLVVNETFPDSVFQSTTINKFDESFNLVPLILNVGDFEGSIFGSVFPSECRLPKTQLDSSESKVDSSTKNKVSRKFGEVIVCSVCGKEFKRKDHLKKHLVIHSAVKQFSCLVCGKKFSRKDRLKEHCVIHSANGWCCYFCGKIFSMRCILRKHEMIHRGLKPFTCNVCDGQFSRKNDLTRHATIHTGEKKYLCDFCGKGFTQKRLVNRHKIIHKKTKS